MHASRGKETSSIAMNTLLPRSPTPKTLLHSFADILITEEPKLILPQRDHAPAWLWLSVAGAVVLIVFIALLILQQPLAEWLP